MIRRPYLHPTRKAMPLTFGKCLWCIRELSVERDCAESQSQQHLRLAITPNLLRLVLRTQPRSGLPAKFTVNLRMH